jgi:hypothetical protein
MHGQVQSVIMRHRCSVQEPPTCSPRRTRYCLDSGRCALEMRGWGDHAQPTYINALQFAFPFEYPCQNPRFFIPGSNVPTPEPSHNCSLHLGDLSKTFCRRGAPRLPSVWLSNNEVDMVTLTR